MKKLLLLSTLFLWSWNSFSQVGIGTTAPDALLDIRSTDPTNPTFIDGLLVPRVDVMPSTFPGPAQNGMMLFLNNAYGGYQSGFYYWDAPNFMWVGIGENNEWKLTGNNINPALHFIGTKNNSDLIFKRSNNFAGHLGLVNSSYGLYSMANGTSATGNTAIGYGSLFNNTSGNFNTALGSSSLYNNQANYNVAVGANALYFNNTGSSNTATGYNSLNSNTFGNFNVANGFESLLSNSIGSSNTAIGFQSLRFNNASQNTSVGANALYTNYTGSENTALGVRSLYLNYSGNYNSALGVNALYSNSGGSSNTALGYSALYNNTSGNNNTALGQNALLSNTTGVENTASGYNALRNVTTANYNSAFGTRSLFSNSVGVNNVAMGLEALYNNTTGNFNVAIGSSALSTNTLGVHNTAVGMNANVSANNLSNTTTIGAYAYATASNSVILGSINGINGATNNTNVGIGTTAPAERLHVVGNIRTSSLTGVGNRLVFSDPNGTLVTSSSGVLGEVLTQTAAGPTWQSASSFWTRSASGDLYPTTLSDRIGIGTSNPATNLHLVSASSNPVIFDGGSSLFITFAENGINRGYFGSYSGNAEDIELGTYSGNLGAVHLTTNNSPKLTVLNGGNVGIGTTTPTQKLDVQGGNARINNAFVGDVGFGSIWANFSHQNQANTTGYGFLHSSDGNYTLINKQNTGTGYIGFRVGNIDQAVISNAGNMGIGTTNPAQKVDIIGKIKITDGTQGVGKVLSSDANGVGTWVNNTAITPAVIGVFPGGGANIGNGTAVGVQSPMTYCNVYIDLPSGKWIVFGTYLLAGTTSLTSGQSVFVRTTLSTSNTVLTNTDIISGGLVSGSLNGPCDFGLANGQTIINNTSGATKRYYLWANVQKFGTTPTAFTMAGVGSSFWSENQLSAIPTN